MQRGRGRGVGSVCGELAQLHHPPDREGGGQMLRCGVDNAGRLTVIAHNGDYVSTMLSIIAAISTC